jgi:hypothetical protein
MPNQYFTNRQEKDTLQSEPEMQEQLLMEQGTVLLKSGGLKSSGY